MSVWLYVSIGSVKATKREESRRRKAAKEEARKEAGIETTPKRKLEIIAFDEMFDKLVQFKEEHGHCRATFKNTENRQVTTSDGSIRLTFDIFDLNKLKQPAFLFQ